MRAASPWTPTFDSPSQPPLLHDLSVDVVIVGAGVTGLTAALRIADAGLSVAVLEARRVCGGVTAVSTAHVTEAIDARYATIRRRFGREGARLVADSTRAALDHVALRVRQLDIACDLVRVPGYLYTEDRARREELVEEHEAARAAGLAVELDAAPRLPFRVAATLRFRDQLRIDPTAYCRGLAEELLRRGGEIYEHTRVVELTDGAPVVLVTDRGITVRAGAVFCATHVPLNRVLVHTKLVHHQSYAAAFAARDSVEDALFWDAAQPYHYVRRATVHGRPCLLVGGQDHKTGEEAHTEARYEALFGYARARYAVEAPIGRWSGQVVESLDGLPFLGRNAASRNVYVATGFGGNGMTFGTLGALVVADLIAGRSSPWAALYDATRIKPAALGGLLRENRAVARHLLGSDEEDAQRPAEIGCDEGRTVRVDGKRLAVCRDPRRGLRAFSARCPHMGCLLHFNEAERTWDCPCHGSRFGVDGQVIDGPAVAPLKCHVLDEPAASVATR